jgi:plastocyanin
MLSTALAATAIAFVLAAPGSAEGTKIFGTVGPGFSISLSDAAGNKITKLDPGQYELVVDDKSEFHNFHLTGPGVDVTTQVEETGQKTFQITVGDGTYRYVCDPHLGDMNGSFTVGNVSPAGGSGGSSSGGSSSGASTATPKASAPVGARLRLTVGPGFTIGLKTATGKKVTNLAVGAYTLVIDDRSAAHNAHVTGPGVNKSTAVPFIGKTTVKLALRKGTLTFVCDPHKATMKGSVTVS